MPETEPTTTRDRIRAVLREAGPLTIDELVTRLQARWSLTSKNPSTTVRNAVSNDDLCQRTADGRVGYLPAMVRGAVVRLPMAFANPATGLAVIETEVAALLWPAWPEAVETVTIALEGGPRITLDRPTGLGLAGLGMIVGCPPPFWTWWARQQRAGATAIQLWCDDGEAGRYRAEGLDETALDAGLVAARDAELRAGAAEALKRSRGIWPNELARRLLGRGLYHAAPPPSPVRRALFEPPGQFVQEGSMIEYRPELTPTLLRLFGHRLMPSAMIDESFLRRQIGLPPLPGEPEEPAAVDPDVLGLGLLERSITPDSPLGRMLALVNLPGARADQGAAEDEDDEDDAPARPPQPAQHLYRLKVSLEWQSGVWRVIEMLDNQTLEDLHLAIQDAFDWDNDHLYAFYLSGKPYDSLTAIETPWNNDAESPVTDEVLLADLELRPGQRILYIFDFGDDLRHQIEVLAEAPAPLHGDFPRIAERRGEAPPQYPSWDEEE